ncbi:MAG: hypothetical protein HFG64_10850 [Lachnospiraceae bacterium]|nr:hypothetical protein [Lachnospiraceae bacterium]
MKLRKLKSKIAQTLAVTMLASALTGGTSLAAAVDAGAIDGVLGQDYKLVTLHTDMGNFKSPMVFKEDEKDPVHTGSDATPSDATTSNAQKAAAAEDDEELLDDVDLLNDLGTTGSLVAVDTGKTETTFVVEGDYLTEEMVRSIIGKPGDPDENLVYGNWESGAVKKAMVSWLSRKGDPESVVNLHDNNGLGLLLEEDVTHLYAQSFLKAHKETDLVEDAGAQGLPENVRLIVEDLAEEKTPADLQKALEEAAAASGTVYENLDTETALQLDIHTNRENFTGSARIRLELPDSFARRADEEGLDFVVIHFGKKTEVITPDIYRWGGTEGAIAGIEFELHDFSPVIVALAKVTSMVDVTLENVENGYGVVYSEKEDENGLTRTYLPIGTTVQIPGGTELSVENTYSYGKEKSYRVTSYQIAADGSEPVSVRPYQDSYLVPEGAKKLVITPVVTDATSGSDEGTWIGHRTEGLWMGDKKENGEFVLWRQTPDDEFLLEAKNWKFGDLSELTEWDLKNHNYAHDLFVLNPDGTFASKDVVKPGKYAFYVTCEYEGETYEQKYIQIGAGVNANFSVYMGTYAGEENRAATHFLESSDYYEKGVLFGKVLSDTKGQSDSRSFPDNFAMYGHEFAGWYSGNNAAEKLEDSTKLEKYTSAFVRFKKAGTNEFYNPVIKMEGATVPVDPDDPNNPDNPNNPSNPNRPSYSGGSSDGSSSSSSYAADTISGSWQRDDRGWRFQLSNGSYAVNQWGRLKGVWYYFGADTYMMTGWLNLNGVWYYLNPAQGAQEGKMKTGWFFDQAYGRWFYLNPAQGSQEGRMMTGWQQINSVWYYLNPVADGTGGAMLADQWVGDYYVNADGAWVQNMTR